MCLVNIASYQHLYQQYNAKSDNNIYSFTDLKQRHYDKSANYHDLDHGLIFTNLHSKANYPVLLTITSISNSYYGNNVRKTYIIIGHRDNKSKHATHIIFRILFRHTFSLQRHVLDFSLALCIFLED